ncbi:MAG: hypothetical protein Q7U32_12870 [Rhodocyclaceae bacterium]|nr:hypothetical protein [Rhodocyclaceae bacterium]
MLSEADPTLRIEARATRGSAEFCHCWRPAMVLSGTIAALWGGGVGRPGFTEVDAAPGGARCIVPDAGQISLIQARHPFLRPMPPCLYY